METAFYYLTLVEFWGNFSFFLIAVSMLAKDILMLRILSSVATVASIVYNISAFEYPAWLVINWNFAFLAINVFHISWLLKERASVSFSEEEKELYETLFSAFSKVEFMKLLKSGTWRIEKQGTVLTKEKEPVTDVILIYNGIADVFIGSKQVAELKDGAIIGEMSFLTGNQATATVVAKTDMKVIAWRQNALRSLIARNPSIRMSLQTVFNVELTKKLSKN